MANAKRCLFNIIHEIPSRYSSDPLNASSRKLNEHSLFPNAKDEQSNIE